jgi:hypothetical protein
MNKNTKTSVPRIPLDLLFTEPEKDEGRLSPDGKLLLYLAPVEGKLGVWVRTLGSDDDRPIVYDPTRPIHWARWQGDGKHCCISRTGAATRTMISSALIF